MKSKLLLAICAAAFISAPLLATWSIQHSGLFMINDLDFPPNNTTTGYVVGVYSLCFKTHNGGADSWISINVPYSADYNAVTFPVDSMYGYIACDSGNVAFTHDGLNWQLSNTGSLTNFYGISFPNQVDTGYAVGASGKIMNTNDGCRRWNDRSYVNPVNFYDVHFVTTQEGWVVGNAGTIIHTTNGGTNWTAQTSGVATQLLDVYFQNATNGWVVGASRTCLKTTNGGLNWNPVSISVPANTDLYSVTFPVDDNNGFVCGTAGKIAKTTDGGSSWEITTLPYNLNRIEFPQDNLTGWVCGQSEAIYKTTDGSWVEETTINRTEPKVLTCTPNPFHSTTAIKFQYPLTSHATLKVFDCTGGLVRNLTLNPKGITLWNGRNELNRKVAPGIYLLELKNNEGVSQRLKLVVLK